MATRMRKRWGDEESDDEGLPPRQELPADADGVRTVIDYHRNDRGETVRTTTRIKVVNEITRIYEVRALTPNFHPRNPPQTALGTPRPPPPAGGLPR